jgi:hypothetical protein
VYPIKLCRVHHNVVRAKFYQETQHVVRTLVCSAALLRSVA